MVKMLHRDVCRHTRLAMSRHTQFFLLLLLFKASYEQAHSCFPPLFFLSNFLSIVSFFLSSFFLQ
jgi:hypothetical protein